MSVWRADQVAPSRLRAKSIARETDVVFDAMYLLADEVSGRLLSGAFEK